MPGPVFRSGETVELRTPEDEDVEFLQSLINDPNVRRSLETTGPVSRAEERDWVESGGEEGGASFLVCVDGDPVGSIGLNAPHDIWGTSEVGYIVAPDYWGNGYATDALREICGYGFAERGLAKIIGRTYATNPASARVMEKVGFIEEGVLRDEAFVDGERVDVHRYGVLAEEWFDGRE